MTVYLLKTKQLQSCPEKKAPNLWQIYIVCRCSVGQRKIMLWLVSNSLLTSLFSYTTFHLIISPILQAFFFSLWSPTTLRKLSDCCSHCMLLPVPPAPGVHLWNQGTSSIWALCKSVAELSQFIGFRGLNVNLFKQSVAYKWYQIKKKKDFYIFSNLCIPCILQSICNDSSLFTLGCDSLDWHFVSEMSKREKESKVNRAWDQY